MKRILHIAVASLLTTCFSLAEAPPDIEVVAIPGATVTLGTPIKSRRDREYHSDEAPVTVSVPHFFIGKYPVTASQFCAFLNAVNTNDHPIASLYHHEDFIAVGSGERLRYSTITLRDGVFQPREGAKHAPANLVTWKGAVLYCQWLSKKTDGEYRVPSEAEWELAAGGAAKRPWPWGNGPPTGKHGERYDLHGHRAGRHWPTSSVGSHPANTTPDGVCDMLGYTIGEWCAGRYVADPKPEDLTNTEMNLNDLQTPRAVRGVWTRRDSRLALSWKIIQFIMMENMWGRHYGRPWTRSKAHPVDSVTRIAAYGFRVVKEAEKEDGEAKSDPRD